MNEPRPPSRGHGHQRQILHPAHADAAIAGHAFGFHEAVIGQRLALEFSEAGVLARLRLVPMGAIGGVMHENVSSYRIRTSPRAAGYYGRTGAARQTAAMTPI